MQREKIATLDVKVHNGPRRAVMVDRETVWTSSFFLVDCGREAGRAQTRATESLFKTSMACNGNVGNAVHKRTLCNSRVHTV